MATRPLRPYLHRTGAVASLNFRPSTLGAFALDLAVGGEASLAAPSTSTGTFSGGRLCCLMQKSDDRGLSRDQRGQPQPKSKEDARPGVKEQKEAAAQPVESPGEPAGGE
jgi:hypothetical protein